MRSNNKERREEELTFFLGRANASQECRLENADITALTDAEKESALILVVRILLEHEDLLGLICRHLALRHGLYAPKMR